MTRTDKVFKSIITFLAIAGIILAVYNKLTWKDSIKNPSNYEYVNEVAFNLGINSYQVTQSQFNQRYINK